MLPTFLGGLIQSHHARLHQRLHSLKLKLIANTFGILLFCQHDYSYITYAQKSYERSWNGAI